MEHLIDDPDICCNKSDLPANDESCFRQPAGDRLDEIATCAAEIVLPTETVVRSFSRHWTAFVAQRPQRQSPQRITHPYLHKDKSASMDGVELIDERLGRRLTVTIVFRI